MFEICHATMEPSRETERKNMPAISIMLKPASALCNLRCKYCFYADEAANREIASYGVMREETLEQVLKRTLDFAEGSCSIVFQGGEPTLAGLDFFRKAMELEQKWNVNRVRIQNSIQTNGILLDRQWAKFFKKHEFLVGISLDGNRRVHDANRVDAGGAGSFSQVVRAVNLLKEYGVDFNVLTVVTAQTVPQIRNIYQFFARSGFEYQQYIPCLDPLDACPGAEGYCLDEESYQKFLTELFDCWYAEARQGKLRYVRYFIGLMNLVAGNPPGVCEMNGVCSRQYVVEADGSVYPCDFYMLDRWRLGNLATDSFENLEHRREELGFIEASKSYPQQCLQCKWAYLCRGGCRRERLEQSGGGLGPNRHCRAFQAFFEYAYPRLAELVRLYRK